MNYSYESWQGRTGGLGRPQAEERQKRFVNGEFIDGVMSMHGTPTAIRFFKAAIMLEKSFLLHGIVNA